jgi:hypothetical protein
MFGHLNTVDSKDFFLINRIQRIKKARHRDELRVLKSIASHNECHLLRFESNRCSDTYQSNLPHIHKKTSEGIKKNFLILPN